MFLYKLEEVVEFNRDWKCDVGEKEEGEVGDGGFFVVVKGRR